MTLASMAKAGAQTGPPELDASIEYQFGEFLAFRASITAEQGILRAAVFYRPVGSPDTYVLVSGSPVDPPSVVLVRDLRDQPLPPFRSIEYWWQVDLVDGGEFSTSPQAFIYGDDRFEWETISAQGIRLHWYAGDLARARAALDLAAQALVDVRRDLSLPDPGEIEIYLYSSPDDLQSSLQRIPGDTIHGQALIQEGIVLLAAPLDAEGMDELERGIPHELTHLLLSKRLGPAYPALPTWLNEGLAILQEASPHAQYRIALEEATRAGELLPLTTLCASFPTTGHGAVLAYAESASVAQYVRDVYGVGAISALLDAYQEGATCRGGVERVLRRSLEDLDYEWRASISRGPLWLARLPAWILPGVYSLLALAIIAAIAYLIRGRRSRNKKGA
jgi:hypothetical protein